MKAFKLFLLAICLALPFGDAFAAEAKDTYVIVKVPFPKRNEAHLQTFVQQIGQYDYAVTFGQAYSDVTIELYDTAGCLVGVVEADYVNVGDVIVVHATEDGAIELWVYSGNDDVYKTTL